LASAFNIKLDREDTTRTWRASDGGSLLKTTGSGLGSTGFHDAVPKA
jgi:hypothetical protein